MGTPVHGAGQRVSVPGVWAEQPPHRQDCKGAELEEELAGATCPHSGFSSKRLEQPRARHAPTVVLPSTAWNPASPPSSCPHCGPFRSPEWLPQPSALDLGPGQGAGGQRSGVAGLSRTAGGGRPSLCSLRVSAQPAPSCLGPERPGA